MTEKFKVEFLEEAVEFIENLDEKVRDKIIYNLNKAKFSNDKELFKKLRVKFGNLGHCTTRPTTGFLHFGTRLKK